jgi:hypothetical protein
MSPLDSQKLIITCGGVKKNDPRHYLLASDEC